MNYYLQGVKSWYQKRPTWVKCLLFIVPVILVILGIAAYLLYTPKVVADMLIDTVSKQDKKREKKAREKDRELDEKLEAEHKRRHENEKERESDYENTSDVHNDIDNAYTIDELDGIDTSRR